MKDVVYTNLGQKLLKRSNSFILFDVVLFHFRCREWLRKIIFYFITVDVTVYIVRIGISVYLLMEDIFIKAI